MHTRRTACKARGWRPSYFHQTNAISHLVARGQFVDRTRPNLNLGRQPASTTLQYRPYHEEAVNQGYCQNDRTDREKAEEAESRKAMIGQSITDHEVGGRGDQGQHSADQRGICHR